MADLLEHDQQHPLLPALRIERAIKLPSMHTHGLVWSDSFPRRHSNFTPHLLGMSRDTPGPRRLRDISDGYYRGASFPHPETTPHPYFPERERANAPPHSMPMVSASGCTAPISRLTVSSWRLDFPHLARAVRHNGARLLRTQAFRNNASACRTVLGRMHSLSITLLTLL